MHPVQFSRKLFDYAADFAALASAEKRFLVAAWFLAPIVSATLERLGFDRVLGELPVVGERQRGSVGVERGEDLVRIAFRRHVLLRGGCLPESITQYALHILFGPTPKLVVGVKRDESIPHKDRRLDWMLGAHAWVENDAGPSREPTFAPIVAVSARSGIWKAEGGSA